MLHKWLIIGSINVAINTQIQIKTLYDQNSENSKSIKNSKIVK
jgi:hypothetical protein